MFCVVMIGYPSNFDKKNLTSIFVKFSAEPDFITPLFEYNETKWYFISK